VSTVAGLLGSSVAFFDFVKCNTTSVVTPTTTKTTPYHSHQLRKSLEAIASCQSVSLLFNKAPSWNEQEYVAYYGYANPGAQTAHADS